MWSSTLTLTPTDIAPPPDTTPADTAPPPDATPADFPYDHRTFQSMLPYVVRVEIPQVTITTTDIGFFYEWIILL